MKIQFQKGEQSGMLEKFANAIGGTVKKGVLQIPRGVGAGYLKGVIVSAELRLMIRDHYFHEDIRVVRPASESDEEKSIIISFNNVFNSGYEQPSKKNEVKPQPSIQIFSRQVANELIIPAETTFRSITIGISNSYLAQCIAHQHHPVLKTILEGSQNFAFESMSTAAIHKTANELVYGKMPGDLEQLYYHAKALELLSHLFYKLLDRADEPVSNYHIRDLNAIYQLKENLHKHPGSPPVVSQLAKDVNMSEPKLRKLFRQTFGYSVFDYYQVLRMQEAARLLREEKLSVSEAGYRMGFTNLSHFTRIFKKHMGEKPKRYSGNYGTGT